MPAPSAKLTKQPTSQNNASAAVALSDTAGKPLVSYPVAVTADDNGTVVGLTLVPNVGILASARSVGSTTVTITAHEAGQVVTGTMIATVTFSAGQLHTAWTSGSLTLF